MKNKFGVRLDSNGYAPSILGETDYCFVCGRRDRALHRHEVMYGYNRTKSKNYGLWVCICDLCHDKLHHQNHEGDVLLKVYAEKKALEHYGWSVEDWIRIFGKNFI